MYGQAQLLELHGKVTSQTAKKTTLCMIWCNRKKFVPYRIRLLAMHSDYLIVIFSVNNSVLINVENRQRVTGLLKIVKDTKTVCPHHLLPGKKNNNNNNMGTEKKEGV